MFKLSSLTGSKSECYTQLLIQARHLVSGETNRIANAANLAALLYHSLPDINWAGFYLFDGQELVVGPFQGLPACVRIPLQRGVCGAAARNRQTQRIDDVHTFADHIACDAASRSELVVPLLRNEELLGVLDIDSPRLARFDPIDQQGIEAIAQVWIKALA